MHTRHYVESTSLIIVSATWHNSSKSYYGQLSKACKHGKTVSSVPMGTISRRDTEEWTRHANSHIPHSPNPNLRQRGSSTGSERNTVVAEEHLLITSPIISHSCAASHLVTHGVREVVYRPSYVR